MLQLDADVAHKLSRRLRKVTARLGTVRELDVLRLVVGELQESGRFTGRALAVVAGEMTREHAKAREQLINKMPIAEMRRLAKKLEHVAGALEQADPDGALPADAARGWQWAVDARIAKRAKALRAAMDDAGALYLPDRLHTVRIAVKKLRYALELVAEMSRTTSSPDLKILKRTQELLGRMHDLDVLIMRVRLVQGSLALPELGLRREVDAIVASIENACRRLHARYVRDRALLDAICERVGPAAQPTARRAAARRAAAV